MTGTYSGKTCWLINSMGSLFNYSCNQGSIGGYSFGNSNNRITRLDAKEAKEKLGKDALEKIEREALRWAYGAAVIKMLKS